MSISRNLADIALEVIGTDAGTSNAGFGTGTLDSVASGGNYNTALGDSALTAVSTGDNNVGVGYQAGVAITTAVGNVAIGYQTLTAVPTAGCGNIAIGLSSVNLTGDTDWNFPAFICIPTQTRHISFSAMLFL